MKTMRIIAAAAAVLMLTGCGASRGVQLPGKSVPFAEGKNYFVRNDVADGQRLLKIVSEKDFDSLFGMAATMSPDGQPTAIDWEKQYVIAVIDSAMPYAENIVTEALRSDAGRLAAYFTLDRGNEKQSYTMRPFAMMIVDRKYNLPVDYKIELQEEKPYRFIVYCKDKKSLDNAVKFAKNRGDEVTYEYNSINAFAVSVNSCRLPSEGERVYGSCKGVVNVYRDGKSTVQMKK